MSGGNKELLAKSEPQVSLLEHIEEALQVFNSLRAAFTKAEILNERFWINLRLLVIFHDLGKAHSEFQKLLRKESNDWNGNRHELFSLPFINSLSCKDNDKLLLSLAAAAHHKDFEELYSIIDAQYRTPEDETILRILGNKPRSFQSDFNEHVDAKTVTALLKNWNIEIQKIVPFSPENLIKEYLNNPFEPGASERWELLLLLGAFKHCDHMASAFITGINILSTNSSFVFLDNIKCSLLSQGTNFYQHQISASQIIGNLFLTAPTGSGKTEAAALWLKTQIESTGQGRCFYILPFTASINAMYERLRRDIGEDNVGMLHGKLDEYLNNYFQDMQYDTSERMAQIKKIRERYRTLIAPVKIITPFQLLKNIYGVKGFEKGIFEWVGGCFIFDEIHAYDVRTFAQISIFLELAVGKLNARVLIMTATLPSFLKEKLKRVIGAYSEIKADSGLYDAFKRHRLVVQNGDILCNLELMKSYLLRNKKVLVVCNTVNRSQEVFNNLKTDMRDSQKCLLLHGYFNSEDRFHVESKLMSEDIRLLVGTQSIEVSLDIDYDVIFSEPAPLDALLQRFGRVNRKRKKDICECFVFDVRNESDKYVYANENIINRTLETLRQISQTNNGIIDEEEIQRHIDYVYPSWNDEDEAEYKISYDMLKLVFKNLKPLFSAENNEEEYYKQFDGIPILPISLQRQYIKHLDNFDFIGAESLMVRIKSNMFARWIKSGNIEKRRYYINKREINYYVTNKKYSSELGLLKYEEALWNDYMDTYL